MKRSTTLLVLVMLVAGCAPLRRAEPVDRVEPAVGVEQRLRARESVQAAPTGVAAALQPVGDCDALLDYFIEQALEQVGPWGLGGGGPVAEVATTEAAADASGGDGSEAAPEPSSTNVQVEGVDEGDIVKADGDLLYVLAAGRLLIFSTEGGGIEELAAVKLPREGWTDQMLLHGDRLVVVGGGFNHRPFMDVAADIAPAGSTLTRVTLIDVSHPSDPTILRTLTVDGSTVTTRLVEGHLRLVLEAYPVGLDWSSPEGSGLRAERAATARNRDVIRNSTIDNWLPYYVTDSGSEGTLMGCDDVLLPPEPSGVGTLSIVDFDLESGIDSWRTASVVASGSTVYANQERTYVATQRWFDPAGIDSNDTFTGHTTQIHRFDTPRDGQPTYVASGEVDGFILNQFAMDEYEDSLRIATTTAPTWWGGGEESVSQVTVMAAEGNRLEAVGAVGDLGQTETIRAVRFMGEVGYVVTFRQTDPLYVIDLSDPSDPMMRGELKIPGYSAYLHPVAEGRLLGVGQDADPDTGAVKGLQISLFDVSDPISPLRLDTFGLEAGDGVEAHVWSPVEGDHRAFTLAGDAGFVPFEGWNWSPENETETVRQGVIQVDWSDDTLEGSQVLSIFQGKPAGDVWAFTPQRSVVKGDIVYAVGHGGISVIDSSAGEVVDQIRY